MLEVQLEALWETWELQLADLSEWVEEFEQVQLVAL